MKLAEFPFLADESVHPRVIEVLRGLGIDVATASDTVGLGAPDAALLAHAHWQSRVVLTHDRELGRLWIAGGHPVFGIVSLRPGHISPEYTLATLRAVMSAAPDLNPSFLLSAQRQGDVVRIQLRSV